MVGNKDAIAAFDRELKGKIFRYVNTNDPIPRFLPTLSFLANDFCHCEQEMAAQAAGSAARKLLGRRRQQPHRRFTIRQRPGRGLEIPPWKAASPPTSLASYLESIQGKS